MSLAQSIEQAKDFGSWLHEKTNDRKFPDEIRKRTGLAILQLSLDIDDAIIVLLVANLPGPALSLARPLFEGYVRGFWLLKYASNEQVNKFLDGKCPNFPSLLAAIGKNRESGGAWIHANSDQNLIAFHNLTHGGSEHVKRRNRDDSVEPSYPNHELESLVKFGNEVRIRIGVELLTNSNDEEAIVQLHKRAEDLRLESSLEGPN